MELQTFAQITGILVLLIGIPLLVKGDATVAFVQEFMQSTLHMRCSGALIVVLSVLTLKEGYSIGTDPAGLIRVVAWLGFIKGITAAWRPDVLKGLSERMLNDASIRPIFGIVSIAMGGLLLYGSQLV
ncbi:hypothetical protein AUJ46_04405 [Candidatus Peregrinibacteria bacterium CG1_02_54_53]|nr:MAG: hypothetical protein AUJ46_04405 [Candidatus Peregrinibacteria bacterium CG1_02_54_53]